MTTVSFHGGVGEIGGNKILVKDRDYSVFLDFGLGFSTMAKYYEEYLKPRTAAGITDFLEMGLLPDLKGIYRSDHLESSGRKPEELGVDACFLSHGHADHVNYVTFLHEDMPIYCGETCLSIIRATTESGGRKIDYEILDFKKRPIVDRKQKAVERKFETFRTGDKKKLGDIEIRPVHVDHSVPGAYGFLIHTSEATIAYTGDLRLHGSHPEMTKDFVEKSSSEKIDALITEGTRIREKKGMTEQQVYEKIAKEIKKTNQVVFADFNFKDVDRFKTFLKASEENGRKMVLGFKEACLLKHYARDKKLLVPDPSDDRIIIYKARKGSGTYRDSDYKVCERDYYLGDNVSTCEEISEKQDSLVIFMNFWNLGNLIDLKPKKGSLFIHSLSEPFNEEMEISEERENNWLKHFGLRKIQAHCSGHASGGEIKELVETVGARKVFPIHTEHPEEFAPLGNAVYVEEGKNYSL